MNSHFDLKALYSVELEKISEMSLVQRFNLRTELYEKILERPACLEAMDIFFRPLFNMPPAKILNINQFLEPQKVRTSEAEWENEEVESFDAEEYEQELQRLLDEKLAKYEASLTIILKHVLDKKKVQLSALIEGLSLKERELLIPSIAIFKEIMVELLKVNTLDIAALRTERGEYLQDETKDFRLQSMVLDILDKKAAWQDLKKLEVYRLPTAKPVILKQMDENTGMLKNIRCSDVLLKASWE